jgi:methionyl-tRNA formyltransferase
MKTVLVGTVETSKVALNALIKAGLPPALLVTLPAQFSSRHSDYVDMASIVASTDCEMLYSTDINSDPVIDKLRSIEPDLCLVIGWSQICKQEFRNLAKLGNIGFHPSALPRFRGRAVIPWTILEQEKSSGSTLFWLDQGIDSGPVVLQKIFSLVPDETAQSLYLKHLENLAGMLPEAVRLVENGSAPSTPQNPLHASYCAKRTPDDGIIDWHQSANFVLRFIRAVGKPYPGAFTFCSGEKLYIDHAVSSIDPNKFIGLTGQIQSHTADGFSVRCGDGKLIEVRAWRWKSLEKPRVHNKLLGAN